jgi:hypothetical protein
MTDYNFRYSVDRFGVMTLHCDVEDGLLVLDVISPDKMRINQHRSTTNMEWHDDQISQCILAAAKWRRRNMPGEAV